MTFMSKTYGSKLNRWVMKPEQWFEYNQWYSCEDYWETNEQCDSSLIRSSGGWSCQSVNIHIRRTLQLDDDFIIYELPVANCQDHPISSSVFQLPIICIYIYTHTLYTYIYIYIFICIHSVCIYIYICTLTIDNWYTNCQSSTPATMKQPATAGCIELVEGGRSSSRCLSRK